MRFRPQAGAQFAAPLLFLLAAGCGADAPPAPAVPLGPDSLRLGVEGRFGFFHAPLRVERLAYVVDWDGSGRETTGFLRSGDTAELRHSWPDTGLYDVACRAHNEAGDTSAWSGPKPVRVWDLDSAPVTPGPVIGPDTVARGADSAFGAVTTDPELDLLTYVFDWGGGDLQELGPLASGDTAWLLHSWPDSGRVLVRVKARDEHGLQSAWSPLRPVEVLP